MRTILFVVVALGVAGSGAAAELTPAQLYAQKCVACHGRDGKPSAFGRKLGAPDLTTLVAPQAALAESISRGKGRMDGYASKLTPEQIQGLAKFVSGGLK